MDREQILAMEPGRELDIMVAETVFGFKVDGDICKDQDFPQWNGDFLHIVSEELANPPLPHYSTDISAAWEVVEKMKDYNLYLRLFADGRYGCSFTHIPAHGLVWSDSAPEVIVKSALLAKVCIIGGDM